MIGRFHLVSNRTKENFFLVCQQEMMKSKVMMLPSPEAALPASIAGSDGATLEHEVPFMEKEYRSLFCNELNLYAG